MKVDYFESLTDQQKRYVKNFLRERGKEIVSNSIEFEKFIDVLKEEINEFKRNVKVVQGEKVKKIPENFVTGKPQSFKLIKKEIKYIEGMSKDEFKEYGKKIKRISGMIPLLEIILENIRNVEFLNFKKIEQKDFSIENIDENISENYPLLSNKTKELFVQLNKSAETIKHNIEKYYLSDFSLSVEHIAEFLSEEYNVSVIRNNISLKKIEFSNYICKKLVEDEKIKEIILEKTKLKTLDKFDEAVYDRFLRLGKI